MPTGQTLDAKRRRDPNLDLLRALAIVLVVVHHVVVMWHPTYERVAEVTLLGSYGITVFFVLSGWLVGGLYWREWVRWGGVELKRFWARRWLRTLPPYYVGLALAFVAVHLVRSDPFDLRYLFMVQNYAVAMPFYFLSWSLCVEEHFYLALPGIGAVVMRLPRRVALAMLWLLPLASPLLRLVDNGVNTTAPFGYAYTATHTVFEGLLWGVAAAFTATVAPSLWEVLQRWASRLVIPSVLLFVSVYRWDAEWRLLAGQTAVALCALVWLAACAGRRPLPLAQTRAVYAIAVTSYSVYLTHSLAIHLGVLITPVSTAIPPQLASLFVWLALITAAGAGFHLLVERPAIALRDRWAAPRGRPVDAAAIRT